MNLLGSTKSKITKDEDDKNEPYLEITEVVLIHCNVANNDYQQNSNLLYTIVPNKSCLVNYYFTQAFNIFKNF